MSCCQPKSLSSRLSHPSILSPPKPFRGSFGILVGGPFFYFDIIGKKKRKNWIIFTGKWELFTLSLTTLIDSFPCVENGSSLPLHRLQYAGEEAKHCCLFWLRGDSQPTHLWWMLHMVLLIEWASHLPYLLRSYSRNQRCWSPCWSSKTCCFTRSPEATLSLLGGPLASLSGDLFLHLPG